MSSIPQPEELSPEEPYDPLNDPEGNQYRRAAHYNVTHVRRQSFYSLSSAQVQLLASPPFSLPRAFDAVDQAIGANADIAEAILAAGLPSFGIEAGDDSWQNQASPSDLDKARSTIRQLYRDWSAEGLPERHACYASILAALEAHVPASSPAQRHKKHVLVPGAGLGRLVFEMCAAGYTVEGNEISYHQLLASNFMLNFVRKAGQYRLYPWALTFSNHLTRENQIASVSVPDIHPGVALEVTSKEIRSEVHHSERMSMTAGDFCVLYKQAEYGQAFDAVVTCFFIDTAPNLIRYVETIAHCLRTGGVWINVGPLLWHFESTPTPAEREKQAGKKGRVAPSHPYGVHDDGIGEPGSFELTNEEVLALVRHFGFDIVEEKQAPATGYIQDPASMLQNVYRPSFWVAKKI